MQKGIRRQVMVPVDCRATSDRTAQVSVGPRRPPSSFWLQAACSRHGADRTVFTSKDGLDAVTWLADKKTLRKRRACSKICEKDLGVNLKKMCNLIVLVRELLQFGKDLLT